jgi:PAS domain S-box-containing protein
MNDAEFLAGRGEMAELIRTKDWSQTPLGPIDGWPQSLRTAVSLCLASNFPINLIWGPQNTQIYNDGYRVVCGDAHPRALGQDYSVTWRSAWPAIGEPFARARNGETSFLENQRMFLTRNGYWEETFFTFSLSPIRDESGGIGGLFHPVAETTATILAERRTRALRNLSANLAAAANIEELCAKTIDTLSEFEFSLPFVLFYQFNSDRACYRLAAQCGIAAGTGASPIEIVADAQAPWPFAEAIGGSGVLEVDGMRAWLHGRACGPYEEGPDKAFVAAIRAPGHDRPAAVVVFGVSPRLPFDDAYLGYYELLRTSISAAYGIVCAREDERRRTVALAEVDRAKTVFFSNVSHEFRTPLTLILGPIEDVLAEAGGETTPHRERLEAVHRNALRLMKLVNALLDFSRIEAGRMKASYEPTELAGLTADLASNFRSACERAGLTLEVDCPPLSQPVHVDHDMWEKIVLNLLSNAFKFTEQGGIVVSLREASAGVELTVRDTGVGIPVEELGRVFERFHRVEGQRARTFEGAGIGLSLVRELVLLHGGEISAQSSPGEGATFHLKLPFGAAHLPPEQLRAARPSGPAKGGPNAFVEEALRWLPDVEDQSAETMHTSRGARIILADDNADMRDYVRRLLESGGYEVAPFANGAGALAAALADHGPDLVLCDVMMPVLDGFGLLKALRAAPSLEGLPVIMLSARAGEEARIEGLAAGADDYLVKPFSGRELLARVDGAIALARQRREAVERERALNLELERRVLERTIELSEANRRISQSEALFRSLYRATPAMMYMADRDGRLIEVNDAWVAGMGYSRAEAVGRRMTDFMPADQQRKNIEEIAPDFWQRGYCDRRRFSLMKKDGDVLETEISAITRRDTRELLAYAVIVDVTAREAAEADLKAKALELQKANDRLMQFTYVSSHDLQEPLRKIETFSELLGAAVAEGNRGEIQYALSVMQTSARRSRQLIRDLLAYSRSTNAELNVASLPLADAVNVALGDLSEAIKAADANIAVELIGLTVEADRTQLVNLISNLIGNAIKYHKPGYAPRVKVTARRQRDQGVELVVEDEGIGFPPGQARAIFDPFRRLHASAEYPGSGIGLAICQTVADRHGWSIEATSQSGKGARFVVSIPRAASADLDAELGHVA